MVSAVSVHSNFLDSFQFIFKNIDKDSPVDVIYLGFQKAFKKKYQ